MKTLMGHVSPETAYVVDDYPYGFKLRCKARYWIETKPNHGQRMMFQTTNPKVQGAEVWNKPKASTYSRICVLVLNESNGHITSESITMNTKEADAKAFAERHAEALTGPYEQETLKRIIAWDRAQSKVDWKVTTEAERAGRPAQSLEEQGAILGKLAAIERKKMG